MHTDGTLMPGADLDTHTRVLRSSISTSTVVVRVKLHIRDKQTDTRNRIWCILALKCDVWWQCFNDFPDNQLTKFRDDDTELTNVGDQFVKKIGDRGSSVLNTALAKM